MSSHNQVSSSETTPLLDAARPSRPSALSDEKSNFSPETLLVPVVFAMKLGSSIPSTTFFELQRQTICRLSNSLRGLPSSLLEYSTHHGPSVPQLCDSPQVIRDLATVTAVFGVFGGIVSLLGCGVMNRMSPCYGRKPVFLFILAAEIMWSCIVPASQFLADGLADWVFLVGLFFQVLSNSLPCGYLIDMYIVDVSLPEERTAAMSRIGGWIGLGLCIPLALGGTITTKTGNPLIVFYMAIVIFVATFFYVISVLPETLSEEKRKEWLRMCSEPHSDRARGLGFLWEPLKIFIPTRTWRLTWCALHTFLFIIVNAYIFSAWLVLATSKYHFTPEDTGLFFTVETSTGMIMLAFVMPRLVSFLRPYYPRTGISRSVEDQGSSGTPTVKQETSHRLDVHLAVFGCTILSIAMTIAAVSTTMPSIIFSAILVGLGWIRHPPTRSLVVSSVGPVKQGEAIAGIEMVHSAARILSPVIMGAIFAATIDTTPLLLFYVHLVVGLVASALLLLVRDSDRFHESES